MTNRKHKVVISKYSIQREPQC